MVDKPVKLDFVLKKRIEKYISKYDNRFNYPSVKNFVDKAVIKLLREVEDDKK